MQPVGRYPTVELAPTWAERRQWQAQDAGPRRGATVAAAFGERELAGLRFVRWLYLTGRMVR